MFGRNKKSKGDLHPAELFDTGLLTCTRCGAEIPFADEPPLSIVPCPECEQGRNFIPLRIDEFWLFAPLGGGGMGSVYEAYVREDPTQLAAVKILPREKKNDPILINGLRAEAATIEQLGHNPCIVSGLGSGFADNEHFLAMEYVQGERLDKRIQRLYRLPELEVILIALRLLQAETHIYNQGYLYRDMKPENVIVNRQGAFLFDYGICIPLEQALSDQGDMVSGSPIYWPPERVIGDPELCASEIYSLGMVIYHALQGEPYFQAKEIEAMARKHVRTVRLSDFERKMKKLRPDIAKLIARMIEREPEDRYQSFAQVEDELLQILAARLNEMDLAGANQ